MTSDNLNDNIYMNSYYIIPEWIRNNNINPNLFLYYEKLYIIKLSKPEKIFIGTLVSVDENVCNFSHIDTDETISFMFTNNEEFSSMIIIITFAVDILHMIYNAIANEIALFVKIAHAAVTACKLNHFFH